MTLSSRSNISAKNKNVLSRLEYLKKLIHDFQVENTNQEIKEHILARLGNFAYDPSNYESFARLNIPALLVDVIEEKKLPNKLQHLAIAGLCNCCLDPRLADIIVKEDGIYILFQSLNANFEKWISQNSGNEKAALSIVLNNILYIFYFLSHKWGHRSSKSALTRIQLENI